MLNILAKSIFPLFHLKIIEKSRQGSVITKQVRSFLAFNTLRLRSIYYLHQMDAIGPKIIAIAQYLNSMKLPEQIELYPGIRVINTGRFVQTHLDTLKSNGCKGIWDVFYVRLTRLKELIESKTA